MLFAHYRRTLKKIESELLYPSNGKEFVAKFEAKLPAKYLKLLQVRRRKIPLRRQFKILSVSRSSYYMMWWELKLFAMFLIVTEGDNGIVSKS